MAKQKRIFVVDGNWYLHRCASTLQTNRPVEDVLPYKVVSMICKDALVVKADYLLVAFDGPKVFRYSVYRDYKSARREGGLKKESDRSAEEVAALARKDTIYKSLTNIYKLMQSLGMAYHQPKSFEADDVMCSVAAKYSSEFLVIGGTQDKDAYQWLSPTAKLYDSSHKGKDGKPKPRYITYEMAEAAKGVTTAQMIDYQVLIGDKNDSIPPIVGIGPSKAKKILAEFGTIANWYKKSKADRLFLDANKDALRRNRRLVTLSTECAPPQELEEWKLSKEKPADEFLSQRYYDYHNHLYPKSKGLFG